MDKKLFIFKEVKIMKKMEIQKKLENKKTNRIILGYETKTEKRVYRILNLVPKRVNKTKNIEWLNMKYGEYNKIILYNQENNNTENMNQVINKIKNILNSIKKIYSLSKIEKYLIKEIERVDKKTDSETLMKKKQMDQWRYQICQIQRTWGLNHS